ncbi:MAG: serine/threonine-protein kinase [Polyangiaceae bacterium]
MLAGGGKEEVRASVLKPYLLRVASEHGEEAQRSVLSAAGVDMEEADRLWISVDAFFRALGKVRDTLGQASLSDFGPWATKPEVLGSHVRMLRTAKTPQDAYRYLADHPLEFTRTGAWECETKARLVTMTYRPRKEDETRKLTADEQTLLRAIHVAELSSYPTIWGLLPARVEYRDEAGDAVVYDVHILPARSLPLPPPVLAAGLALLLFGILFAVGTWISALIAALVVGGTALALGQALERVRAEGRERAFEKNRIAALEQGLALKGDSQKDPSGELTGAVLAGKYKIRRRIGSGGIGAVYAAEHTTLGHEVAIKVLRGAAARDASEIARLRREAQIQTHVEHPNVARVFDLDQMADGSIFIVMERLHGRSLADRLQREGLVAPGTAIPVFIDVCRGLAAAHAAGVVHRDLKPGNVFLCDDGTSKILDFGMSKLTSAEALTQQGYTLGTPEYMAPEQCIGATVEARTDLYALGVLMYEALVGELPIRSSNRRELLDLHQREVPQPLKARRPDLPIPDALDRAIMLCLEKKVNARPRSAEELGSMLEAISLEGLPKTYPLSVARKRKTAREAVPTERPPADS